MKYALNYNDQTYFLCLQTGKSIFINKKSQYCMVIIMHVKVKPSLISFVKWSKILLYLHIHVIFTVQLLKVLILLEKGFDALSWFDTLKCFKTFKRLGALKRFSTSKRFNALKMFDTSKMFDTLKGFSTFKRFYVLWSHRRSLMH